MWKLAEANPELQMPDTQTKEEAAPTASVEVIGHLPESASLSALLLQGAGIKATGFQSLHIQRDWINGSAPCPRLWSTEITDSYISATTASWDAFFSIFISIFFFCKMGPLNP